MMMLATLAGFLLGAEAQTYQHVAQKKSYNNAKADCESRTVDGMSGYLVVIQSEDEYNTVNGARNGVVWIGNKPNDGNYDVPWDPSSPQTGECVRMNKSGKYQDRSCSQKFGYVCEFSPSCSTITDPCDCTGDCGWSTSKNQCVDSTESTTNCIECNTLAECKAGECMDNGCPTEFDPLMTCSCTDDCDTFGNCCSDVQACKCDAITDVCSCIGECGWSTSKGKCVLSSESTTNCVECNTLADCKAGECMDNGCPKEFDPLMTCSCQVNCADFGSCCSDVQECRCDEITDPCACTGACGWSGSKNKCVLSTESTTDCGECNTLGGCIDTKCEEAGCPAEYDEKRICQCNDECDTFGNCCDDVMACRTESPSEPPADGPTGPPVDSPTDSPTDPPSGGDFPNACKDENGADWAMPEFGEKTCDFWMGLGLECESVWSDECPGQDHPLGPAFNGGKLGDNPKCWEKCGVPPSPEDACECKDEFDWDGTTYYQCAVTETNGAPWCYVKGGASCNSATESETNAGEFYVECDRCECKDEFVFDSVTYNECTDADDTRKWCYVKGGHMCADASPSSINEGEFYKYCKDDCECKDKFMWDGKTYYGCTVTSDGGDPWCYVDGGAECKYAVESKTNAGEFYKKCNACDCKVPFIFEGKKYKECTMEDDTREWCYVKGGEMCALATKSTSHMGEYYKYCDDCLCKDEFKWEGDSYYQCSATEVGGEPWCYVKGEEKCESATESLMRPGEYYVECERCECKDSFEYKGQTYTECTDVEDTMPWCYVKNPETCEKAVASTVEKGEAYKYCQDMCSCMPEFEWEGQTYTECTVTSPNGSPWCYVIGGELCETAVESNTNAGMYYVECDACDCKEEFKYKGKKYFDCTDVEDTRPWCYVKGGEKCAAATKSKITKNSWYKYCDDCECKDEWKWEGTTITECTATEPPPARGWCYVKGEEKCLKATESLAQPGEFYNLCDGCECKDEFMWEGKKYTDCTVTSEGGKPWCYVKGDEECEEAKESKTNPGEFYKHCDGCDMCQDEVCEGQGACLLSEGDQDPGLQYTCDKNTVTYPDKDSCDKAEGVYCTKACEEDPCECMDEFYWEGKKYTECTITEEGEKSWCYVKGGASCTEAHQSQKNPSMYYLEECGHDCDCKDEFMWNGEKYTECAITEDSNLSWCYVKGGSDCEVATQSTENPDEYYIENCGHMCDCKDEFKYKGKTYTECTEVDSAGYPWCYVEGGDRCEIAIKSMRTSSKAFKYCDISKDPCKCKDSFVWDGVTYNECTVTSRGGKSWCYVEGGATCTHAVESKVNAGEFYIQNCGNPCDCKDEFEWDGQTYTDCTVTSVDGLPWCYVKGDDQCDQATESSTNIGEFYRYCGKYWLDRPCFKRERLDDDAAADDEFPATPGVKWARGALDSTMFPNPGATLFHTLYRTYAEDKLCMKFGNTCTKITELIINDGTDPYPVEKCQEECENTSDCAAYVIGYDRFDCDTNGAPCVITCMLYEKCIDIEVTQDGTKYSEIFLKAGEGIGEYEGKYDGPIMRMNYQGVFMLEEIYGLGIIPRNRRRIEQAVVDPLAILTRQRKVDDGDVKAITPPGACGHHCVDAESPECQQCCQTFQHETSWQCGSDSEAKCCNSWNSTCFWERGEHNFHHGCKDCAPAPSEYEYWIDQAEAAYACQQLCTMMNDAGNFDCRYWMAIPVVGGEEEERRRLMDLGFLPPDVDEDGTPFESHVCTFFREKPAVYSKSKPKKGKDKQSKDPYISGKRTILKASEAMTNDHDLDCYNTGFPFGLLRREDLFSPIAYNNGKEAYQPGSTFADCAKVNMKLEGGVKRSDKTAKSMWDCAKACADKPESDCEKWKYNGVAQKCEMRVTKPAQGRKPESVPEFADGKDYTVSGDRTCYEAPNPAADCVDIFGDCSLSFSED